jgi:hypothetical protein
VSPVFPVQEELESDVLFRSDPFTIVDSELELASYNGCIAFEPPDDMPSSATEPFLFAWNAIGGRPQDHWANYMGLLRLNLKLGLLNGETYVLRR